LSNTFIVKCLLYIHILFELYFIGGKLNINRNVSIKVSEEFY